MSSDRNRDVKKEKEISGPRAAACKGASMEETKHPQRKSSFTGYSRNTPASFLQSPHRAANCGRDTDTHGREIFFLSVCSLADILHIS